MRLQLSGSRSPWAPRVRAAEGGVGRLRHGRKGELATDHCPLRSPHSGPKALVVGHGWSWWAGLESEKAQCPVIRISVNGYVY